MLKLAKILLLLLAVPVLLALLANYRVSGSSRGKIYQTLADVPQKEVALVLGTSKFTSRGNPNLYYSDRLKAAADLFAANKVRGIIVSGDNSSLAYNEPQKMRKDLIELGVPAQYITSDYAGVRTFDSIVRVKEVFGVQSYVVVTQEFHLKRALYIALSQGHDAVGFGAGDEDEDMLSKVMLREFIARAAAFLDVNLGRKPKFLGAPEKVGLRPLN